MRQASKKRFERFGAYPLLLMGAAAMLIFGSLGGWVNKGTVSIPGIAGDGIITIISGVIILGIVLLLIVGEGKRLFAFSLAGYIAGFLALFISVYYLVGVARCSTGLVITTVGIGLYVTLAGATAAVIGSLGNIATVSRSGSGGAGQLSSRDRVLMLTLTLAVVAMVITVFLSVGR